MYAITAFVDALQIDGWEDRLIEEQDILARQIDRERELVFMSRNWLT